MVTVTQCSVVGGDTCSIVGKATVVQKPRDDTDIRSPVTAAGASESTGPPGTAAELRGRGRGQGPFHTLQEVKALLPYRVKS